MPPFQLLQHYLGGVSHAINAKQVTVVPGGPVATHVLTGTSPTTKNVQGREIASANGAGNKTKILNLFLSTIQYSILHLKHTNV